jgi:ammonia channel protein AmtB
MNQKTLDTVTTILGLVAGVAALFGSSGVISEPLAGTIGGISAALLGYFVQRPAKQTEV